MDPVLLPDDLLYREPRRLHELMPGEEMHVAFTSFYVDEQRRCFLDGNADARLPSRATILVKRGADASYHVDLPSDLRYKPRALVYGKDILNGGIERIYFPVASINIVEP
jgi:hypothetical protein